MAKNKVKVLQSRDQVYEVANRITALDAADHGMLEAIMGVQASQTNQRISMSLYFVMKHSMAPSLAVQVADAYYAIRTHR